MKESVEKYICLLSDHSADIMHDILRILYYYIGAAVIAAVIIMYAYIIARKYGIRKTIGLWFDGFIHDRTFRRVFLLMLYIALVVSRTLVFRDYWADPLLKLHLGWGVYDENGDVYVEGLENMLMLFPMTILFWWSLQEKYKRQNLFAVLFGSAVISFIVSIMIELCQLVFHAGTFQYSDLVYNTVGGAAGGAVYYVLYITGRLIRKLINVFIHPKHKTQHNEEAERQ